MEAHMGGGVVWLPLHAKVIEIPGDRVEGGYAKIRQVRISRMENIPSDIDFAGKLSKANKDFDQRKEWSMEALACPVSHAGVIKFWAFHPNTMEAYMLWWNGSSLHRYWTKYNSKVSEATSYEDYHLVNAASLLPNNVDRVKAYRKNRVKLVLSLLTIMDKCHAQNILHNDLSPSNIMLHFPPRKPENVYIGVCDWGMASRVKEKKASLYDYQKKEEMVANIAQRKHVVPELFYVFGPEGSRTSLEVMQKKHLYTKAADAYSVGVLASLIWKEGWDRTLLPDATVFHGFELKLRGLQDKDPQTRLSISNVLRRFTSAPFNMVMPEYCFRKKI
jgi:serine/threonine protein kinase